MASLMELCSICFTNIPKYTCPRCGCQTCSLNCVKTHKKRAKCTGIRDPASYKKSSELATPASIDQDYNFIAKVQRDIERAEDDIAEHGITLVPAKSSKNASSALSKLELEHEASGVVIIKAPTGLTRSRQNKTHWDNRHKCVMWTVEWALQDGQRIRANVQGGRSVLDAFTNAVGRKGLQRKRKLEADREKDGERPHKHTAAREEPRGSDVMKAELHTDPPLLAEPKEDEEASRSQDVVQRRIVDNIASQMHFYLHRPRTSSKWVCLIPVSPSTSISDMLRGKTVLEFPTFYALHDSEDQLTPPFITEKCYDEQHGIDIMPRLPVYGEEDAITAVGAIPDHIDDRRVMEVLRKDLDG